MGVTQKYELRISFINTYFERTSANGCFWFFKTDIDHRRAAALCGLCSHHRCSVKKVFVEISVKFTGKYMCQSFLFNKVAGLRPGTGAFSANFVRFLKTPFFIKYLRRLLLHHILAIKDFYYSLVSSFPLRIYRSFTSYIDSQQFFLVRRDIYPIKWQPFIHLLQVHYMTC